MLTLLLFVDVVIHVVVAVCSFLFIVVVICFVFNVVLVVC